MALGRTPMIFIPTSIKLILIWMEQSLKLEQPIERSGTVSVLPVSFPILRGTSTVADCRPVLIILVIVIIVVVVVEVLKNR